MIPASTSRDKVDGAATSFWQQLMADAISDPGELLTTLEFDPALIAEARAAAFRCVSRARVRPGRNSPRVCQATWCRA
jgi:hypothetical protein